MDEASEYGYYAARDWQRFYMGYQERFVDDCVLHLQDGRTEVRVSQAPSARAAQKKNERKGGKALDKAADPALTGTTVWDGAVVLSHLLADTNILEQHHDTWRRAYEQRQQQEQRQRQEAETQQQQQQQEQQEHSESGQESTPQTLTSTNDGSVSTAAGLFGTDPRTSKCQTSTTYTTPGPSIPHGQPPTCLELGAGTGLVSWSLLAARQVHKAIVTDLPDLLPHLNLNLQRNQHLFARPSCASVQALSWGPQGDTDLTRLPHLDLIVGSDLIYYTYSEETPHSKLLLWTLQRLATPHTIIYLALSLHHNPEEVEHFLGLASEGGFHVHRLHDEIQPEFRVHDVLVVRLTKIIS